MILEKEGGRRKAAPTRKGNKKTIKTGRTKKEGVTKGDVRAAILKKRGATARRERVEERTKRMHRLVWQRRGRKGPLRMKKGSSCKIDTKEGEGRLR